MYSSKVANALRHMTTQGNFAWWSVLVISMLSFTIYIVVTAYGTPYEYQIVEMLFLVLSGVIFTYTGVQMHKAVNNYNANYSAAKSGHAIKTPFQVLIRDSHATEFEQYLRTINIINKNVYADKNGAIKNIAYSRSCGLMDDMQS